MTWNLDKFTKPEHAGSRKDDLPDEMAILRCPTGLMKFPAWTPGAMTDVPKFGTNSKSHI